MSAPHSRADVSRLGLLPNQLSPEMQLGPFAPDIALCPLSVHLEQQGDTGRWELSRWRVESLLHRDCTVHFP